MLIVAIMTKNKRIVTSCLRSTGLSQVERFEKFHRVLNCDKSNTPAMVKVLVIPFPHFNYPNSCMSKCLQFDYEISPL